MANTNLKQLMDSAGLSQYRLAKATPLNQGRLSLIMRKKAKPTEKEIKLLEGFFGLPLVTLLQESEDG